MLRRFTVVVTATATVALWSPRTRTCFADPRDQQAQSVEVLAYGFPGIGEDDLGVMFTADLKPVAGAPRLYDKATPKHVPRNEFDKHLLRASETATIDAGAQFLFVGLGVQQTEQHDVVIFHAHEVKYVAKLGDAAHVSDRPIPDDAVFYLAEVNVGSTADLIVEGDYSETGQRLSLLFSQGSVSGKSVEALGNYQLDIKGLGFDDFDGSGALAMTLGEIQQHYKSAPAPIELVFRTIPGRTYRPPAHPTTVFEVPSLKLKDGAAQTWQPIPPGTYRFVGSSKPNGLAISWTGAVNCDQAPQREYTSLRTTCTVRSTSALIISNPPVAHDIADQLGGGPDENMSLYLLRMPVTVGTLDPQLDKFIQFFDHVASAVIGNSNNCNRMATAVDALIDANADVIAYAKGAKSGFPDWARNHITSEAQRMVPALKRCAGSQQVNAAFTRLQAGLTGAGGSP